MQQEHPDLLEQAQRHKTSPNYYQLTACEWNYLDSESFDELNRLITRRYDSLNASKWHKLALEEW